MTGHIERIKALIDQAERSGYGCAVVPLDDLRALLLDAGVDVLTFLYTATGADLDARAPFRRQPGEADADYRARILAQKWREAHPVVSAVWSDKPLDTVAVFKRRLALGSGVHVRRGSAGWAEYVVVDAGALLFSCRPTLTPSDENSTIILKMEDKGSTWK